VLDDNGIEATIEVNEKMGSSVHLHVNIQGKDVILVVSTMNMTGAEVAALKAGATIKIGFAGKVAHVFNKETEVNLEF
jgi:multiple sugar transport system ATP-binding protein